MNYQFFAIAWPLRRACLTICGVLALACSSGSDGDLEETVSSVQAPATSPKLSTWTPWTMPLAVCFRAGESDPPDPSDHVDSATLATWSSQALSVLQATWGQVRGVSFTQSCSASQHLTVLFYKKPETSTCNQGVGATCLLHGFDNVNPSQFVHETGHALGLAHEHQRSDAVLCQTLQTQLEASVQCANNDAAGQACTAADYNQIFHQNVSSEQRLTEGERQFLQSWLPNNVPDPTLVPLTRYDPMSIVNYCDTEGGRPPGPPGSFMPTALDLLGVEMLYPQSSGYALKCSGGCFNTSSGVIVRTDGVVTSDWTARGALNVPMSATSSSPGPTTLAASALPAGTATFTYSFWDPRGSRHTGSGVSQKSNAMHAAVVSILGTVLL